MSSDELLRRYGEELTDAVEAAIGPWVAAAVRSRLGRPPDPAIIDAADAAADAARRQVTGALRALTALDIDDQWTNPLAIIRSATAHPTAVLRSAGVAPVDRDVHDARINPDDVYALAPAAFADLGERVHDAGLRWGAAKAHVHLERRKERNR